MLPPAMLPAAVAVFLMAGIGINTHLALPAMIVLLAGGVLLWRPGETPILLFIFCYQWLQATISIFHANWLGLPVNAMSQYGADMEQAIILSLIGLVVLALGMRLGAGQWHRRDGAIARMQVSAQRTRAWFFLFGAAWLGATFAEWLARYFPGLSQPALAVASVKWACFWVLAFATFIRAGGGRQYFLAAFGLELLLGFGGFFSDFKTVIFFTMFAFVASGLRVSARYLIGSAVLGALILTLGLIWTAIKKDYRDYVSGGEAAQIVTVSYGDRIAKLTGLVGDLSGDDLNQAGDDLLRRITYVEFFGVVLRTVPRLVPYEGGALWWDAITRPFMPRMLFPEKTVIDDSERTNFYTGLRLAGADRGASISIGYMGESYIDFGEAGMMGAIFGMGLLMGAIYKWFLRRRKSGPLFGMALATAVLYGAAFLESSITKVFGGIIVSLLIAGLVVQFVLPWYVRFARLPNLR